MQDSFLKFYIHSDTKQHTRSYALTKPLHSTRCISIHLPHPPQKTPPHIPDDNLVALFNQLLQHPNLGRHLRSTHNSGKGALGGINGTGKVVELLLQQKASYRGGEELGHTLSGCVGTVGCAKGIVDVQVSIGGKLWRVVCERVV